MRSCLSNSPPPFLLLQSSTTKPSISSPIRILALNRAPAVRPVTIPFSDIQVFPLSFSSELFVVFICLFVCLIGCSLFDCLLFFSHSLHSHLHSKFPSYPEKPRNKNLKTGRRGEKMVPWWGGGREKHRGTPVVVKMENPKW